MRRRIWAAGAAILAVGGGAGAAALALGGGSGTTDFGPYTQRGDDGSTCSNVWAHGKQAVTYRVFPQAADGTYTVQGRIVSSLKCIAATSVGACNNEQHDNGATIGAGVRVKATDDFVFVVSGGTLDP